MKQLNKQLVLEIMDGTAKELVNTRYALDTAIAELAQNTLNVPFYLDNVKHFLNYHWVTVQVLANWQDFYEHPDPSNWLNRKVISTTITQRQTTDKGERPSTHLQGDLQFIELAFVEMVSNDLFIEVTNVYKE